MTESYNWIMGITDSCTTIFQLEACLTLIELFKRMYIGEDGVLDYYILLMDNLAIKDALLTH
jgi:hypothetical protein